MSATPRRQLQYNQVLELFPLSVRNQIFAGSEYRSYSRDQILFQRHDEGTFMAAVMSGRFRMMVRSPENKELLITMVERGELVGEMSVLDDAPRAVDVISETDSTVMIIKRDDFLPILRSNADAMMGLLKLTCHRMRSYLRTMEMIALEGLPARMARYLLQLADDYGTAQDGGILISSKLSQADIAQQLACSRESVNKQLANLIEKKLIALQDQGILLLNPDELRQSLFVGAPSQVIG
jgi:CRP-like cAMP-binding protein